MQYSTLTSQNQITIPSKVRDKLQLKPGDKLAFYAVYDSPDEVKMVKIPALRASAGVLSKYKKNLKSGATINEEGVWTERYERFLKQNGQNAN